MGDQGFVKKFADAERPGAYGRVIKVGAVAVGDQMVVTPTTDTTVTLRDITIEWHKNPHSLAELNRILATPPRVSSTAVAWSSGANLWLPSLQ